MKMRAIVIGICAGVLAGGCAVDLREPVPLALVDKVEVAGVGQVRGWGDVEIADIDRIAAERAAQISQHRPHLMTNRRHVMNYLAISGGGADGAFGAGFLNGWSAAGTRPEFEVVSGVSAGALIAPFAFLGPAYDQQLREIYTRYSTKDLIQKQVLAGLAGASSVSDTKPLADLIARYVDIRVLQAIAREHRRGRRLLVGTTNLDQERPVIWDMGRIAAKGTRHSLELFRAVLLASSALPGLFPPVYIQVEADGATYQEMHVDGGTTENAFLLPLHLDLARLDKQNGVRWKRRLYVITNAKTRPTPKVVKPTTYAIAGRSIEALIRQQTEGDLIKLYLRAGKNKIAYSLASIPVAFAAESREPFDRKYMKALFETGYALARAGYRWQQKPPGL